MNIKTQKIIKFIPIVNFSVVFCWIGAYAKYPTTISRFLKKLCLIFSVIIILNIPRIFINKFIDDSMILSIITLSFAYVYILLWDIIAIKDEEDIIKANGMQN